METCSLKFLRKKFVVRELDFVKKWRTEKPLLQKVAKFKMTSEEKSIKVIEFTGADFKIWSNKFVARANRKGYKGLLKRTEPIPTTSEYDVAVSGSDEKQEKIEEKAILAFYGEQSSNIEDYMSEDSEGIDIGLQKRI